MENAAYVTVLNSHSVLTLALRFNQNSKPKAEETVNHLALHIIPRSNEIRKAFGRLLQQLRPLELSNLLKSFDLSSMSSGNFLSGYILRK